jgi:hypothetical protein
MHATIRRYEGIDKARTDELTNKVSETYLPRVSKLDGFRGYYLIETNEGVHELDQFLRHHGTGRRVDPPLSNLVAR